MRISAGAKRQAARLVAIMPWYGWAAAGLGTALLLGARRGAAAAPPVKKGPMPTIQLGSSGAAVTEWQTIVGVPPTGKFDASTRDATKAWQSAHGLTADGIVGPKTWAAAGYIGTAATPKPSGGGGAVPKPSDGGGGGAAVPGTSGFGLAEGITARENQILDHVAAGHHDHEWAPLTWSEDGHTVSVLVSRRALALSDGAGNRLIVNATYPTAQKIADMLGGVMLTTRVADEIWRQAPTKIAPLTRPWSQDDTMAKTSRMVEQSAALEKKIGSPSGLVANEGKDWVLTRKNWLPPDGIGEPAKYHNGANFGWYGGASKSPGGESVVQSVGMTHALGHTDYSQLLRFVKADSLAIDGVPRDLKQALSDPATSSLLQDEGGTIPDTRHPDL